MNLVSAARMMFAERRSKMRPEALIWAAPHLLKGWTVMDRLGEITVPTLVMAGRDDFVFPPEHQAQLAAGIPNARLQIIERAGHNPHDERTAEVMDGRQATSWRHRRAGCGGVTMRFLVASG